MAKLSIKQFTDHAQAERHYLNGVDRLAEAQRARYITAGSGQAMTYEAKVREALVGDGPLLQVEATALEMTVTEVAATVLAASAQWMEVGAAIEGARLKAKKQIRLASTTAEMHAITQSAFLALGP